MALYYYQTLTIQSEGLMNLEKHRSVAQCCLTPINSKRQVPEGWKQGSVASSPKKDLN
jgi:hypothetical protein